MELVFAILSLTWLKNCDWKSMALWICALGYTCHSDWSYLNVVIDSSIQDLFVERYFKCNANWMAGQVIFFLISSRTYTVSYWYFDQQNFEIFCNRCTMDTTKILNNQQNWKNSQKIRKRLYTKKKTSLPCPLSIDILRAIT